MRITKWDTEKQNAITYPKRNIGNVAKAASARIESMYANTPSTTAFKFITRPRVPVLFP
jgi:hypothetical protein